MARRTIPVQLRWADTDVYGHVNNVAYFLLLEEIRIRELRPLIGGLGDNGEDAPTAGRPRALVAGHTIDYLEQMPYHLEPVRIDLWVSRIGRSSVDVFQEFRAPAGMPETVYARAMTVVVYVDQETQRPRALTEDERKGFASLIDTPAPMRGMAPVDEADARVTPRVGLASPEFASPD